jgi:type IV pilus assembly protein PilM
MLEFLTLEPEAFGIDISDLSLKIMKLKKKKDGLTLASFGEAPIKEGIIHEGEIKDENKLAEIVKEALTKVKGKKINTKYVIASLPEEKAFLQVIQMPKIPEEDLKSAVIYEAENYIPFPIEEGYLDSQIVKPLYDTLDHYDVLIAALPKKIVYPYLGCLRKAGLIPQVLEIESLAIARAIIKNEISPFPTFLIDLGATRASFIIYSGYSLRFTSSIPISSREFNEAIVRTIGVDFKKAEALKIKYGLEILEKILFKKKSSDQEFETEVTTDKKIFEALTPVLTDLSEQIKKCISFYQSHALDEHLPPERKNVKKILLSGGGANLKGLTDFLSLELKIPVELANPWVNILPPHLKKVPELSFEESLRYATVLGLALRGIKRRE